MGQMCSGNSMTEAQRQELEDSKKLGEQMYREHQEEQAKVKLLLLGAGESGKSTLFRQMEILYGKGFTEDERRQQFTSVVYQNTIMAMKAICTAIETLDDGALLGEMAAMDEFNAMQALDDKEEIKEEVGALVKTLWADPTVQKVWARRSQFQVVETNSMFFDDIDRIMGFDFVPSEEDILRVRVRTSGIIQKDYVIEDTTFVMFDVGGQRNERKKWIHCFDEVNAVIFVAAISEYDQVCFEDATQNRMVEALTLFKEISNSKWFVDTSMILFLNKRDLFETKVKTVAIKDSFEAFDGPEGDIDAGIEFFLKQFLDQVDAEKHAGTDKEIYHHVTCATDSDNVRTIFNACKEIILKNNLSGAGFM